MFPIDVVIANYNNAKYLTQCIESVLCQKHATVRIIVIDDASTDDSIAVLGPYVRAGKIDLLRNEENQGVAASRLKAIQYGNNPYVTTLDADDFYYDSEKLFKEARMIGNAKRGRIAFSDVMRVDEAGSSNYLVSEKRKLREGDLAFHISHLNGFIPRDYLVSRADYTAVGGYNKNLKIYEDWDLKIKLSKICTWHFSGVIGIAYRKNARGLSGAPLPQHISTMRKIFVDNCEHQGPYLKALMLSRFFIYHSMYVGRPAI